MIDTPNPCICLEIGLTKGKVSKEILWQKVNFWNVGLHKKANILWLQKLNHYE